ncbi:MAG: 3-(cis-5,6-dihydroxycyclohexa-1,3-dien-1-yl)propanoate dehydrogenase [Phenylobacterium sp.]|uniref:3-(cis-5,6-dihydroxycyclohexa-1, 3-dien-1-yl)propanoate dehydrogenase n=1 Tax=Phenylobacterium sp. TaxID=1871053 RepID=UPI002600F469|nr:3-(cis-5,6-dihydroxycyclohexa-1,3-dien-1-yl)propanoate dehydrogenase [Phenylobacterium sp.]MBA4013733.1 3-(cis-5,6-dihydroxycyclohexa-1,3-dien-1-yl)propanoate dehydrogenase [Phenylobacterium sp.]
MTRLKGEVVLITGGASGLGRALVDRFVEEGARVAVLDRSPDKLAALSVAFGEEVATVQGDVRSLADNQRAVAVCCSRFGRLDCAVGNAGIWDYSVSLDALPEERLDAAFDEMFHINVKGYLLLAKAALPSLAASGGSLIYTVSNAGFDPAGGGPLYTAAKHAVVGLIRQLAYEFAPVVRVNGVAPGPIVTDLRGAGALGLAEQSIGGIDLAAVAGPNMPLAMVPTAEDYTGAYVTLASRRDNRAATGGVISLDAGIAVRGIGRPSQGAGLSAKYGAPL